MARSGLPREQVQAIIDAQAARTQRLAAADWVLFNGEGVTVGELQAQINVLAQGFGL
jgi:dephospho-CoA kinase